MKLSISQAAGLFGLSARALRYYDEIGLLKPSETAGSGYRYYDETAVQALQQIAFYRELGFSLKDIADIMSSPDFDRQAALRQHLELLKLKKRQLETLIELVDQTLKGEINMEQDKVTAADIEAAKKKYAAEAAQKWGKTDAWAESRRRHSTYDTEKEIRIELEAQEIMRAFASNIGKDPACDEVRALVERWKEHISKYHYDCSNEILSCLGSMYVSDERFARALDGYAKGNAQFISDAIASYIKSSEVEE
ncbi:MAG: MerR family transcriptional regulator [Clostridiales bacterium]|jgi:DNA-binding transcriptional MerR regulator|nr:MerR family transcriptional regulator [Clostridiales bacterium]